MITRDAETFVALAQAVTLAYAEGALDDDTSFELTAALVAGIVTGSMELTTYGRVHDALALLLEKAFEGPVRPVAGGAGPDRNRPEEPLGVYLEVVGNAWDRVTSDDEPYVGLTTFVRKAFDLGKADFGGRGWFCAPVRTDLDTLLRLSRAAGLAVLSVEGTAPKKAEAVLQDPSGPAGSARVLLGWGDRRLALDLVPPLRP